MLDNMERLRLVSRNSVHLDLLETRTNTIPSGKRLYVSEFGKAFVRAFRLPKHAARA
jgi:hypothetical protein